MSAASADHEALARRLAAAFASGGSVGLGDLPALASLDEAEQAQDSFLQAAAFRPRAWKLGASTVGARQALGLDRPFFAPLPAERTLSGPAQLRLPQLRQRGVECELAVSLRALDAAERTLLQAPPSPQSWALTAELVIACHAAIEIPESRFLTLGGAGSLALVADNGAAGWVVVGPAGPATAAGGRARGTLSIDGEMVDSGDAEAFVAPPLRLVQQFLHRAVQRRLLPDAPTVVLLGSVTPYRSIDDPAEIVVQFDGLPPAVLNLRA